MTDALAMIRTIGVFSGRSDLLSAIRSACPSTNVATDGEARDAARLAVVDGDTTEDLAAAPKKNIVRIVLVEDSQPRIRRNGELLVQRGAFLERPADFIGFASDMAEAAIHASQLEVEVSYLSQIHELMTMGDAGAVSERIVRTVLNLLGLSRGSLFLHDPRVERYVVAFSNDKSIRDTGEFLPGVPPDLLQKALSSGDHFAFDRNARGGGMIIMPLQVEHDLVGVIKVPIGADESFDEEAADNIARYLRAVAQVLGNIYQLSRSRDLAMRDDLTKAFNRRFFDSYLDEEIERSRRYGALCSIIFLDLDDLKTVNNAHGHLAGSRTLQEVAKRILGAVRGIDKAVRFGGDEFCIILPQTDQEQAMLVANRVRKALISAPFFLEPEVEIHISASFGIATYPTHGVTKDDLIRQADAAMYRVKSTTKNAVGVASVDDVVARPPMITG
jgi:diguanylate cyclase (GGDEF)-like protein